MGVEIVVGDIMSPEKLNFSNVDIIVSTLHFSQILNQIPLLKLAKSAGVRRFVPCDWGTASDPEGEMVLREVKESVRQSVRESQIPYTFIDVGYWFQVAVPEVFTIDYCFGDGNVKTALTDLPDIGKFVARILLDDRTIGKYVFIWAEELSQNEIHKIVNKYSDKVVNWRDHISPEALKQRIKELRANRIAKKGNGISDLDQSDVELIILEYGLNKNVNGHNTPKYAKEHYGALDARELYPDIKPRSFDDFAKEFYHKKGVKNENVDF